MMRFAQERGRAYFRIFQFGPPLLDQWEVTRIRGVPGTDAMVQLEEPRRGYLAALMQFFFEFSVSLEFMRERLSQCGSPSSDLACA